MAKIKLTDLMADAMTSSDRRVPENICYGSMGPGTLRGLISRGLIETQIIRNGDLPGYVGKYPNVQNRHAVLTPAGRIVQADLRADADRRTWTEEELTPTPQPCGSWSPTEPVQTCKREAGHAGLCRPTASYVSTQQHWDMDAGRLTLEQALAEFEQDWLRDFRGHVVRVQFPEPDRDAGRLTLEEALEEAHTDWRMGEPAVVRIGYVDGTTEEIRNIPRGEMAAGIFAEAVDNDRVVKAELVRGDGTVAARHPRDPMPRVMVVPGVCGLHVGEDVARAYGRKSLAACCRMPGHIGRHRSTRAITVLTLHWTDEQCAPLDPQP